MKSWKNRQQPLVNNLIQPDSQPFNLRFTLKHCCPKSFLIHFFPKHLCSTTFTFQKTLIALLKHSMQRDSAPFDMALMLNIHSCISKVLKRGPQPHSEVPDDQKTKGHNCVREVIPQKPRHYEQRTVMTLCSHGPPAPADLLTLSWAHPALPTTSTTQDFTRLPYVTKGHRKLAEMMYFSFYSNKSI